MKKRFVTLGLVLILALTAFAGCAGSNQVTLNVLNWGDYIDETVIADFEAENPDIKINYTTLANNEEMLVQLSNEGSDYDICFPSDYIIEKMLEDDMLAELDHSKIPNIANIDARFMDLPFDPDNKYSVPYMWGTVGIVYNTTLVDDPVDSWDILWNPKYEKQIIMYVRFDPRYDRHYAHAARQVAKYARAGRRRRGRDGFDRAKAAGARLRGRRYKG